tara:strand:+ start:82 stop:642 length:561 start_codon:yes stop_codon:yes gene_type:complete
MPRGKKGQVPQDFHRTRWCGPTALAVLTGRCYKNAYQDMQRLRNRKRIGKLSLRDAKPVSGVWLRETLDMLDVYGYNADSTPEECQHKMEWEVTFAKWLRETYHMRDKKAWYLVHINGHFCVMKGNKVFDQHTPANGTTLKKYRFRRTRVVNVYKITRFGPMDWSRRFPVLVDHIAWKAYLDRRRK